MNELGASQKKLFKNCSGVTIEDFHNVFCSVSSSSISNNEIYSNNNSSRSNDNSTAAAAAADPTG